LATRIERLMKTTDHHKLLIQERRMDEKDRAAALGAFLIDRRARLKPADVGLPHYGARRCRGLRREEVAELVGVSTAWYTFFEVGRRNKHASLRMVTRVASALRLDERDSMELLHLAVPELARFRHVITRDATA
jgi:DNA-binding XRE family transcriptional regulator